MNEKISKNFINLSLETEVFLYSSAVPFVVYFFILTGGFGLSDVPAIIFGTIVAGSTTLTLGLILRNFYFKSILKKIYSEDDIDLEQTKIDLLNYPKNEISIAIIRWILAGFIFTGVFSFFKLPTFKQSIVLILDIGSIIPISSLCYYYITEKVISDIILKSRLKDVKIDINKIIFFNFSERFIYVMIFSSLPLLSLFYLIQYYTQTDNYKIPLFNLQFFFLFSIYFYLLFRTAKEGSRNLNTGINNLSILMQEYSKGNLRTNISINSRDEIGKISIFMNQFTDFLKETINAILNLTGEVLEFSKVLAEQSENFAKNNSDQFSFLQEVSASLEQMSAVTDNIANNARLSSEQANKAGDKLKKLEEQISEISVIGLKASRNATETSEYAENGQKVLNNAIEKIQELNTSTTKISEAVGLISEVADQVNLLSLNASIESARAGEFGKGFAVVASEISKLAEKTLGNSKDIIKSSKEVLKKSEEGKTFIQNTGTNFTEILSRVQETTKIVKSISLQSNSQINLSKDVNETFNSSVRMSEEISNATEEQRITNRELVANINKMNDIMENINSSSSSLLEISKNLESKIKNLDDQISFFKI